MTPTPDPAGDGRPARPAPSRWLRLRRAFVRFTGRRDPVHVVAGAYLLYSFAGFVLLSLPFAQAVPVEPMARVFMAVSATATTGMSVIDVGTSFTWFGQLVLLLLMQLGAFGYLTISTFVMLSLSNRMTMRRTQIARASFNLPQDVDMKLLMRRIVIYSATMQVLGVMALFPQFADAGVQAPLWQAIFHSVAAFTSAGLTLFGTNFEGFTDRPGILFTIAGLALAGSLGFLIMSEVTDLALRRRRSLGFTARVAMIVTVGYLVVGTWLLAMLEPQIHALPPQYQVANAFFMTASAGSTVGLNSVPVATLAPVVLFVFLLFMMFGASPGGSGGGLKTSTFGILVGLMVSTLRRRERVTLMGLEITPGKLQQATASVSFYFALIGLATIGLLLVEAGNPVATLDRVLFETISSLSGVGMSQNLTPTLSDAGLWIVMALMLIGRIGILAFGVAIATRDDRDHDPPDAEVVL